ncbi:MAG TPA: GlsB/YeaQ/YmgE family stress response membrane protein [Actinophytocola sp.]|jgi:uncharacterized membrane protein YeaQ/YmgE (transglycosylase-associated protein family)|uniref:GlsB/YeaQ/YmgE family stress response membrane protein n=1 Tax=Actinophytocola sp. TaxID=1872138 RepID=UPI002DF98E38|nr:GlsB/YeaQ/YmgE family stress response membrane protein [Actinophytocola sp.]
MVGAVAWIMLGIIAGVFAKSLLAGKARYGVVVTTLVGIAGALLGGWAASELFHANGADRFFDLLTWLTAIAGSAVLLLVYHVITSSSPRRARR